MFLAVPSIWRIAASIVVQFKSGIFFSAISRTCAFVIFPTFSVSGLADPLAILAAFLTSSEAGGVFRMKVYERSS